MSQARMQDDLFRDFKEQQRFITDQVKLFDPVAESLSRPAATHLSKKIWIVLLELVLYVLCIGTIAFAIILHNIKAFSFISNMMYDTNIRLTIGIENVWKLQLLMYTMLGLIALLFFVLAQNVRSIRIKNDIIHKAAKNIKILAGQLLKRKAAVDAIEQRYFVELPDLGVNDISNPGYDDN